MLAYTLQLQRVQYDTPPVITAGQCGGYKKPNAGEMEIYWRKASVYALKTDISQIVRRINIGYNVRSPYRYTALRPSTISRLLSCIHLDLPFSILHSVTYSTVCTLCGTLNVNPFTVSEICTFVITSLPSKTCAKRIFSRCRALLSVDGGT